MKQFLILGGESRLARCFRSLYPNECIALNKNQCDITDLYRVRDVIKNSKCGYILNCAAITDIETCEKNPSLCFNVNAIAVYSLSKICLKYDKKLIHISSNSAVRPVNMYGWSKFLSEKIVNHKFRSSLASMSLRGALATKQSHVEIASQASPDRNDNKCETRVISQKILVVRTDFYDKDSYIVKNLMQKKPIKAYTNVYFNPISINHLAYQIYIHKDRSGIINIFTNKKISFYDFAQEFCDVFGLYKTRLVKGIRVKPLNLFVKSTINRSIDQDLMDFKRYIT